MRYLLIGIAFCCLFGCATSPVRYGNSKLPSDSQILSPPPMAAKSINDGAEVIIIRDSGATGSALKQKLLIDGVAVVELWPGERYEAFLTEGEHIFGVIPSPNLFGTHGVSEITAALKKGKTFYFRIYTDASMTSQIQRSAMIK